MLIYERSDGWARVSFPYTAGCSEGRSAFVESGNSACEPANGIDGGEFSEWVDLDDLVSAAAADSATGRSTDLPPRAAEAPG